MSASAHTIIVSLPPNSRLHGMSRSAARTAMRRPVATEPVNITMSTASTTAAITPNLAASKELLARKGPTRDRDFARLATSATAGKYV
jgi:hypothetical protein